ncbi:MAG: hypothetical protein K8M05_03270 [Deltaproteobacteria bacterium]|nr:hypothetical protein [Kofleriaceae bacterium]
MILVVDCGCAAGCPTEAGGLHKGSPLRKVLDEACAAASVGRRVTPHGLRHTANDLLRRVASAEVTRAIVGHATEQMTHQPRGREREARGGGARAGRAERRKRGGDWGGGQWDVRRDFRAAKEKPGGVAGFVRGAARI